MGYWVKAGSFLGNVNRSLQKALLKLDVNNSDKSWMLCLLIFISLFLIPLMDRVPSGRDWIRYWHPLHDYFSRFGIHFGVIWQEGGGVLTTDDPSSFVFDPIFILLNQFITSPLTSVLHLLLVWLLGLFSFNRLMVVRGVNSFFLATAFTLAYGFNGLALSVVTEQFIPIYFYLPFFLLALEYALKIKNRRNLIILAVASYFLCYTAAPSLAFFIILFILVGLERENKKTLIYALLLASIPLSFPYTGLVIAKLRNFAPYSYLPKWSFSPQRIFFILFPEFFNLPSHTLLWMNHELPWESGYSEPYFRSIFAPIAVLAGLLLPRKSQQFNLISPVSITLIWIIMLTALIFSMVGICPTEIHEYLQKTPFFIGRYHEKYLLIFFPMVILCGAEVWSYSSARELRKSLLMIGLLFLVNFSLNSYIYPRFLDSISHYTPLVYAIIAAEILLLVSVGVFAASVHLRNFLVFLSVMAILPISSNNFERNMKPYSAETDPDYNFVRYFGTILQGNLVLIPEESTIGPCLKDNQSIVNPGEKEDCSGYLSGGWLGFSIYSPKGYTSFYGFKDLYMKPLESQIINIKPQYLVMPKKITDPKFCVTLLKREDSIIDCQPVYANGYQGPLNVYKLVHGNNIDSIESLNAYHLKVSMTARTSLVRIPFFIPPGSTVEMDGREVDHRADEYGTIISRGEGAQKALIVIDVKYNNYVLRWGGIIAALMCALTMVYGIYYRRSNIGKRPI